jgi:hypothetical protein
MRSPCSLDLHFVLVLEKEPTKSNEKHINRIRVCVCVLC